MAVVTVRPNNTNANGGTGLVGDATRHGATDDDPVSDSSYVRFNDSNPWIFTCPDPTIPEGGVVTGVQVRVRSRNPGIGVAYPLIMWVSENGYQGWGGGPPYQGWAGVSWQGWITHVLIPTIARSTPPTGIVMWAELFPGTGNLADFSEVYVDTLYVPLPVPTVSSPSSPPDITTTNRPTVVWDQGLDALGGAQTHFEVKVFNDAQYNAGGFDPATSGAVASSGITAAGDSTWHPSDALPNDTYRAFVRVAQTINGEQLWSAWDETGPYSGFVLDVEIPATPALTATAISPDGLIEIGITNQAGGEVPTDTWEVQRSLDGGTTWEVVRTLLGDGLVVNDGGSATLYDQEAPNGTEVTYRAQARAALGETDISVSAWSGTDAATWSSDDFWLKHSADPTLNLKINQLTSYPGKETTARQGVFQALGAARPVVVSDVRGGATGQVKIRFDTDAEREALDALLAEPAPLLLQLRPGDSEPDRWVVINTQNRARYVDAAWHHKTHDDLDWIEVERPLGNMTAWPTPSSPPDDEEDMILA